MTRSYGISTLKVLFLIRMSWTMGAEMSSNSILCLSTMEELMARLPNIDTSSNFYTVKNLSGAIKGDVVTKDLFNLGYKNIFLTTGFESRHFTNCSLLKAVAGKDFPFSI